MEEKEIYWADALNKTKKVRISGSFCGIPISIREYLILFGRRKMVKFYLNQMNEIIKKCPYCDCFIKNDKETCPNCSKIIYHHL